MNHKKKPNNNDNVTANILKAFLPGNKSAQAEQERINALIIKVKNNTPKYTFTSSFDIFKGKKVTEMGRRIKRIIRKYKNGSIHSYIADFLVFFKISFSVGNVNNMTKKLRQGKPTIKKRKKRYGNPAIVKFER